MLDLIVAVTILGCLVGLAYLLREQRFAGNAFVVDGDSLVMDGRRIRLRGLDAPELGQLCHRGSIQYRCGEEAKAALRTLVAGQTVVCASSGRDRFDRMLARCEARGEDLGSLLVRRGLAVSFGAYEAEESEARQARRGLWAGPFETPQAWRRRHEVEERS